MNDSDIKRILCLDGTYLPCTVEDLIRNLFEQAKAWQALSFLVKKEHRNLPLIIQSNKLAREIEKSREEEQ